MTIVSHRRARLLSESPSRALAYLPATALVLDAALITASTLLGLLGRLRLDIFSPVSEQQTQEAVGGIFFVIIIGWVLAIAMFGGYSASVFGAGPDEYKRVTNAGLITAGLVGVGCYLAKYDLARGFFLLTFAIGIPALVLGRLALRRAVHRARKAGALQYRVVIVGTPGHVDEIAGVLRRETWLGYQVVGALTPNAQREVETPSGIPIIGGTDEITWSVITARANLLFFAGGAVESAGELRRIAWALEKEDVQVVVAPSVTEVSGGRVNFRPVGGLPLIHVDPPRSGEAASWGKRGFDVLGSLALLVAFSPVFLLAALRIKLHDRGPVLFSQERVGKDGMLFSCLKFRTMVVDAEARLAEPPRRERLRDRAVQAQGRPPRHQARRLAAQALPRRAAAADQRAARRHEPGRPPPAAAARGRGVRARHQPPPRRPPRPHRPVAGLRPLRPVVGGDGPPRPLLRRQLVDAPGPQHPGEDRRRRPPHRRRLLTHPALRWLRCERSEPVGG